jgi:hypothetical protein
MPDTATKTPILERINLRLIVFAAVVLTIIGYPAYVFIKAEVTGGVEDAGGGYKLVDLKAMSLFDFDQSHGQLEDIPKRWRELDGQKVILCGEIAPGSSAGPLVNQFSLCYSVAKCCFQGPPQVQHFVNSRPIKGAVPWYSGLVKVKGTLHIDVKQGEGKIDSIYQMDVESVEPMS